MSAPTYCQYCGRELVEINDATGGYDVKTGERQTRIVRACPVVLRPWWLRIFGGHHAWNIRVHGIDDPDCAFAWLRWSRM